jgi:hypothetical protein
MGEHGLAVRAHGLLVWIPRYNRSTGGADSRPEQDGNGLEGNGEHSFEKEKKWVVFTCLVRETSTRR